MKIHVKNPTTTPIPITTTVDDYEPLFFYEFSGDCTGCEDDSWIVLNEEITATTLILSNIFNEVSSSLGLILNLIHLFILTRKDLRSNVVFFIMIGIAVCDTLTFTACIAGFLTSDDYMRQLPDGRIVKDDGSTRLDEYTCLSNHYWKKKIEWYSEGTQKFGRLCSTVLALSMTSIRTVSVLFPMSSIADSLMKLKSALIIVTIIFAVCGAWYAEYYFRGEITEDTIHKKCYFIGVASEDSQSRVFHEGLIILLLTVLYLILTVILLVTLRKVKQRRKNLRSEKSDNTFNLIVAMTISFFIAEIAYCGLYIANNYPYKDGLGPTSILVLIVSFRPLPYALMTLNSVTHCFVCFFMSSQYREVVLKIFWRSKNKTTVPNVIEATKTDSRFARTTKITEESSRKTY